MLIRTLVFSAVLLSATLAKAQPFFLDCSCLATQSVLITNACQALVPDLCQFTNCYGSTVVPPLPLICSQTPPPGTPVGPGSYPINVTVSDQSGVASLSCALVFKVGVPSTGCAAFTLLCASNKTVECGTPWTFDPPTWTNACAPPLGTPSNGVMVAVLSTVTNGTCPMVITRTWQAVDDCMQVATCSQTITVVDTRPPLLDCRCLTNHNPALPPIPLTVTNCSGVMPDLCQYALLCAADACGPLTCTQSPPAGTILGPGVHPFTVTVLDCASNAASCTLNFTVVAPTPPGPFALICAPNKTVECGTTWGFDPPSSTNSCCPPLGTPGNGVTITVVGTITNGICPKVYTRTWRGVDACGNVAQCSQSVTAVDTTPPVLNCNCIRDLARNVLRTNDCFHGIVPDLCLYTNCFADTCGPISCSQNPPAGTVVGVGIFPITVTISDCAGNTASCTVPFRVEPLLQTNVWNSGMGGNGTILLPPGTPDPNYGMVSAPIGGCPGPSQVLSAIPSPPWVANGPNSQWIGTGPTAGCQPGEYHYRLCFYLPCTNGAAILGQWAADDWGAILLNGQPTGHTIPSPQFPNIPAYSWFPVALTNGFVCGSNCLDFYVTNANIGINPTGFRAELTNVIDTCCMCTSACVVTIVCPPNQTNYTCGINAVVTYPTPTATSTCGTVPSVVCAPPSGATFPLGPTTVNCVASDGMGHSNTCSFVVTVIRYTTPWMVQCPPLNLSVTGCPPVMPNLSNLITLITNCPISCPIIITQDIAPGTVLNPGTYVVIIRSCDCNGLCFDCDVVVTAVPSPNCCTTTPVLTLNSGANATGVLPGGSLDPQFQTGPPLFVFPNPIVPTAIHALWLPNTAVSKWVSPKPALIGAPLGNFYYTNRFFLCSTNQAVVTGRWSGDDTGDMRLNGGPAINALPTSSAFASWTPVSITSGFVPGWNQLVFRITNSVYGSVTGLRTEIRATACCNNCVTITCPPNRIVTNCPPGAAVTYAAPTTASACGTIASVSCTPASGSFFPIGTNTVTCAATDSAGNAAMCSFTVAVVPAAGPVVLMCPTNQVILTCGTNAAAYYKVKAMGQVGLVVCTPPSGTVFPMGTNVVICRATNACGMSSSCSFLVIVKSPLLGPPTLTLTAGLPDSFVQPPEPSPPSACMITAFSGFLAWKGFDSNAFNVLMGHRFTGLPNNIVKAELVVHMVPTSNSGSSNDGIFVGLPTCLFSSFRYSASIASLAAAGGSWNPGHAATTFTFNLGALNPLIISDLNLQQYLDVVIHDDTTVDYMQLRLWVCPPPSPGTGVPHTLVGSALSALRPAAGVGVGTPLPAICVFPNPNVPSGILLQPGAAKKLTFTTVLDFQAPEGAGIDLMLPPDPRNTNGMPFLSFHRKSGPKGYCVKTAKLYDDEPDINYRSIAVGTNGDLFPSFAWDAANIGTNVLLYINHLEGVTSVVMTVTLDLETREAVLEFPHCLWTPDNARKGWDGCIYGNGTPSKGTNKTARLILTPTPPHTPLPPVFEMSLLATGLTELLVEDPEIETMGRKWGDGHVTLMKAYDDGETERLSFITVGEGGGVHADLGHAATFSIGIHHFRNGDIPNEEQVFRLIGPPPRGLTNRPTPPTIPLRLANGPGGVHCSVDFSDLAAEAITVQLLNNGVLVGQGSGLGAAILPESPLILDRWPDHLARPALKEVLLSLSSVGEPFTVSGIVGDELRFIPALPPGEEPPEYYSRLECETSDGMDNLFYGLERTLACPPAPLTVQRGATDIMISWTDEGYRLQGSEGVAGPWFDLSDTSPVVLGPNHRARYFRLICD